MLVRLLDESGVPAWIAYTGRDAATMAAGEPFAEAIAVASSGRDVGLVARRQLHGPAARARAAQDRADVSTGLLPVAYLNRGDTWDPESRTWRSDKAGSGARRRRGGWPSGLSGSAVAAASRLADIERLAAAVA